MGGGELCFQRAFAAGEANYMRYKFVDKGLLPLGQLPLKLGQLTAWPNSHVHRLASLTNHSGGETAQRRIVVFWLVNPDRRIISSRHVAPQQNSAMTIEEAKAHRVELMEERKRHKQD